MINEKFDKELAARAYDLIAEKYATEGGKKFIFHLISSFIVPSNYKVRKMTLEDSKNYKSTECCITKARLAPIDVMIPQEEGVHYYGWVTEGSNKIVSIEGMLALQEFIKKRLEIGDDAIGKIYKYINRNQQKTDPKMNNRYQPHPDRKNYIKSKKDNRPQKPVRTATQTNEAPRYYPKSTFNDVMPEELKNKLTEAVTEKPKVQNVEKKEKVIKESKAKYEDTNAFPNRRY